MEEINKHHFFTKKYSYSWVAGHFLLLNLSIILVTCFVWTPTFLKMSHYTCKERLLIVNTYSKNRKNCTVTMRQELHISHSTLQRILIIKDLHLRSYKIQRRYFCQLAQHDIDDAFQIKIIFIDETHFHLYGFVNKHNYQLPLLIHGHNDGASWLSMAIAYMAIAFNGVVRPRTRNNGNCNNFSARVISICEIQSSMLANIFQHFVTPIHTSQRNHPIKFLQNFF